MSKQNKYFDLDATLAYDDEQEQQYSKKVKVKGTNRKQKPRKVKQHQLY